ncbi:MAG TPA: chemotaxis protein CheW [Gemmatimonadales bacterium]|nr:chemotaxis protein CheW [Gemmatimonadales bacterium]
MPASRGAEAAHPAVLEFADRLAAAPEAAPAPAPAAQLQLITFRLDAEEFGIPIESVREVTRVGDITRVPRSPRHVRGVTNLRGRILPVLEIRSRLGLEPLDPGPRARIVVVEVQGRLVGLLVDAVAQVQKVAADRVVPPPDEVRSAHTDYLTGVVHLDRRLIILLDLERVLGAGGAPSPAVSAP